MNMTLEETLAQLESLGNEKVRARNRKNGAGDHQFGVQMGDIRAPIWIEEMVRRSSTSASD